MAKWGQGDPRWIVEERPDATNVNNWHWTEKDATKWSERKLHELFTNVKIPCEEDSGEECTFVELGNCDGEATVNNRKGRLILFYEWNLEMCWRATGMVNNEKMTASGKIFLPNFSEENKFNELDISTVVAERTPFAARMKELVNTVGAEIVREKLAEYIKLAREEYSKGLILPGKVDAKGDGKDVGKADGKDVGKADGKDVAKDGGKDAGKDVAKDVAKNGGKDVGKNVAAKPATASKSAAAAASGKERQPTKKELAECQIELSAEVRSYRVTHPLLFPVEQAYKCFTDVGMMTAYMRCPVMVDAREGGKFSMFNGHISGEFISLEPNKNIKLLWRIKDWRDNIHSLVELIFEPVNEGSTHVTMYHTRIPESELEKTRDGWNRFYWNAIKETFNVGVCNPASYFA